MLILFFNTSRIHDIPGYSYVDIYWLCVNVLMCRTVSCRSWESWTMTTSSGSDISFIQVETRWWTHYKQLVMLLTNLREPAVTRVMKLVDYVLAYEFSSQGLQWKLWASVLSLSLGIFLIINPFRGIKFYKKITKIFTHVICITLTWKRLSQHSGELGVHGDEM